MKLTSSHPFWSVKNGLPANYPSLQRNVVCEAVVIGGGITGALAAVHLAEAGVKTLVIDKRDIGAGSTSASTALLQYEIDVPLRELIKKVGPAAATRSYLLCLEAIGKLERLAGRLKIDCGFERKPSLFLARHQREIPELREEYQLRRKIGIELEFFDAPAIRARFPFLRPAALFSKDGGQVDPHRLTRGLLTAGKRAGLEVYDRTQMTRLEQTRHGVRITTHNGCRITARRAVIAAGSSRLERTTLEHSPEALAAWIAQLRGRFGGQPVGICLEQTRGALIHALMSHAFIVLYPVNPTAAKRYRDAFAISGAKDDPVDAELLWELLARHRDRLRPWHPDDVATRHLALLCEHRRQLVDTRTKLVQKLTATLKAYFPQMLAWAGAELASPMACDFVVRWPTLAALQRAKPQTIRTFYYAHRCRNAAQIAMRLAAIQTAQPLTTDPAVVEAHALLAVTLARQLRVLLPSITTYDQQLASLFASHPDAEIFRSFPGAGDRLAPRLAAAFGTDRNRFPDVGSIQQLSGIAPVTCRSGQSHHTYRRRACPKFLRQTFHEFAGCSLRHCAWANAYYEAQRAQSKAHQTAVRALAFKWMRILWRCWQDRQPYQEQRYLAALRRHGSPLVTTLASVEATTASAPLNN